MLAWVNDSHVWLISPCKESKRRNTGLYCKNITFQHTDSTCIYRNMKLGNLHRNHWRQTETLHIIMLINKDTNTPHYSYHALNIFEWSTTNICCLRDLQLPPARLHLFYWHSDREQTPLCNSTAVPSTASKMIIQLNQHLSETVNINRTWSPS